MIIKSIIFVQLKIFPKILIPSAITNPTAPIATIPIAEIFEIVLNSMAPGFFKTCQTLFDCKANDFNFINMLMTLNRKIVYKFLFY